MEESFKGGGIGRGGGGEGMAMDSFGWYEIRSLCKALKESN